MGGLVECPKCGQANREAAKFCAHCAAELHMGCAGCGAELSSGARFCDQCGTPVGASGPRSDAPARKVVTVLFADLAGSTAFGEQVDAESARDAMAEYHAMARGAIEGARGTVAKFIGDGVMAVFGVPETAEDDADRAVAAGLALQRGFEPIRARVGRRHGVDLGLRVGINTGEIVLADGDADLVGDAINTAARLEAACEPGDVLVGEDTWRLTRSHVRYEVLGEVEVSGKAGPVATFRVVADDERDDRAATPFVGRSAELSQLRAVLDDATERRTAHLVAAIGAPGVGKTRLAREFGASAADGATVVEVRCERTGTTAFAPIADLLRAVTAIGEQTDPAVIGEELLALLVDLSDAEPVVEALASFVGAAPVRSTEESFLAVRRLVEALGRRRPLVLIVDDIQWAEPLFLDLLEHLAEWVNDAPAIVLALARPEIRERSPELAEPGRLVAAVLGLEGLDPTATAELAARLVGASALPPELVARLPESTEGNPLFVRELMRMLVDDGVIERDGPEWRLTIDADAVEVPPTIQSLLAARLDRMPPAERRLVELASVVGPEFALGAVAAISEADVAQLRASLELLRRRELIDPTGLYWGDEPIFRFHHVLIRDAAYRRLLKRTRSDLHLRVGDWTERTAATLPGEHEVAIAHHFEHAHEYRRQLDDVDEATAAIGRRAGELFATAALRALARDDLTTAVSLAERSLARVDEGDPLVAPMLVAAAEASLAFGDLGRARPYVDRLRARVDGDRSLEAWARSFEAQITMLTDSQRLHEAEHAAEEAAATFAELGDEAGVAKARLVRAGALARLGQVGRCEDELDLALTAARAAGDRRRVAAVLGAAPVAALWGPSPIPRAGGRCLDVIRLLRITTGSPAVEATSVRCQAVLEALRGRFDTARSMLRDARATVEELGLRHALNETDLYTGIVELLAGDPVEAEEPLRSAYYGLGRLGIGADAGQAAAYLARSLLQQGRIDEAEELAAESAELAGENPQTAIAARAAQAEILAARGRYDDAVAVAAEAVARAEGTDIVVDHAHASSVLARVADLAGDRVRAERAAATARSLYEQKAATVSAPPPKPSAAPDVGDTVSWHATSDERDDGDEPLNEADRLTRRFIRLFTAGAREEWIPMLAADHVTSDRRPIVGVDTAGADEVADAYPRDHATRAMTSTVETVAVRGQTFALIRWRAVSASGREWDSFHLTRWTTDGLNDLNVVFPPDQIDEALAELDRLHRNVGGDAREPWNDADRLTRGLIARFLDGSSDDWIELIDPDHVTDDRRSIVGHRLEGRDEVAAMWTRDRIDATADSHVETIATRGERLALHRWTVRLQGGGVLLDGLHVTRWTGQGQADLNVRFDPTDLAAAVEALARLYQEELGDSVEAIQWREFARGTTLLSAGDLDGFLALHDPGFVMRDHRALGWPDVSAEQYRERLRSVFTAQADVLVVQERLVRLDGAMSTCAVQRVVVRMPDGREQVSRSIIVMMIDAHTGLITSMDQFEEDCVEQALERFDELVAERGRVLLNEVSVRSSLLNRWLARGDDESAAAALADDSVFVDQDGEPFEPAPVGRRVVMAVRGDHLALVLVSDPGQAFVVERLDDEHRIDRVERFRVDELPIAFRRLHELFLLELAGPELQVATAATEFARAATDGDVRSLALLLSDDFVTVDRRAFGFEEADAAAYLDTVAKVAALPGALVTTELLRLDADGVVTTGSMWTVSEDGDVTEAFAAIRLMMFRDGQFWRVERFEIDDRDAALARFDELTARVSAQHRSARRPLRRTSGRTSA